MRLHLLTGCWIVFATLFTGSLPGQDTETPSTQRTKTEDLLKQEKELRQLLTEPFLQYEQLLQAVNKTRFPEEKNFVLEVAVDVQEKRIPKTAVDAAWLWVRKKRPTTNYPFVYFERILRLEGERVGFEVPPFDQNIYSRFRFGTQPGIPNVTQGNLPTVSDSELPNVTQSGIPQGGIRR